MSDITGEGWGSDHKWKKVKTNQHAHDEDILKCTLYECKDCGIMFIHRYEHISNVFSAMIQGHVPHFCPRKNNR
jgi:tRNA U34 5-carboxymethylaminomethyl modifying enzyme MnmG/GidA